MANNRKKIVLTFILIFVGLVGIYFNPLKQNQLIRNTPDKKVNPASSEVTGSTPINASGRKERAKRQIVIPKSTLPMTKYLLPNSNSQVRYDPVTHVVIHFTSNALNNPMDPYLIDETYNIFKNVEVSSHYVIGRKGEIYSLVAENRVARHAGKGSLAAFPAYNDRLNDYSMGIELLAIGTREEMISMIPTETFDEIDPSLIGFTEAQYQSLSTLLNDIIKRNSAIRKNRQHIVGHDEYAKGRKTDPGILFDWEKLGF